MGTAARYQVLPLSNRILDVIMNPRPRRLRQREQYVYHPFGAPVPESVAVVVRNRSHTITADVDLPDGVAIEGVLLALGNVLGGFSFHVKDGRLRYVHNLYGKARYVVDSDTVIGPGAHALEFRFTKTGDSTGFGTLLCDGEQVGEAEIPRFTPSSFNGTGAGLSCGYELGPSIGDDYDAPFRFNGTLHRVEVSVTDESGTDARAQFEAIMAEQ